MAPLTEWQQVRAARKRAASRLPISDWLENTWSDLKGASHHVDLLVGDLEAGLDADRGRREVDTVTLRFQTKDIERTIWLASTVWSELDALTERTLDRLNQSTAKQQAPAAQASKAPPAGVHQIRHIDQLGEAEDRLIALQLMVDGMADRNQSSAFSLTVGDIHGLVTSVRDSLNAQHEGRAA